MPMPPAAVSRAAGPPPLRRRPAPRPPARPWRRRLAHYSILFVIVVVLTDALAGEDGLLQRRRAREAYQEQRAALEQIREENRRLLGEIRRLRDDPRTLEALARRELGFARPDEVVFVVRDAPRPLPAALPRQESCGDEDSSCSRQ